MRTRSLAPASMHAGPNMTPLVDVVMVILIFLMLAGSFGIHERFLAGSLVVPAGVTAQTPAVPITELPQTLDIAVHPAAGGFVMQMNGAPVAVTADALLQQLRDRRAQFTNAGVAPDGVQIVIRPTGDAPWDATIGAFDAAIRADFKKVNFSAVK